jgi:hypothetical protein
MNDDTAAAASAANERLDEAYDEDEDECRVCRGPAELQYVFWSCR